MRRTIFSEDSNAFLGTGFAPEPGAGQLDSDVWSTSGFSDPAADEARGLAASSVSSGGIYAVDRGDGDTGLLIQPSGSDFTAGALTLSLNSGDTDLTDVRLSFDRLVRNDQARANSFNLEYSLDGIAFLPLDSFTSEALPDGSGELTSTRVTVALPDLGANTDITLRWVGDDVSGSGSRDEFGIDNLVIDGLGDSDPAPPGSVVINQVLASTIGADSEYIELFGEAGASLAGLSFIGVESNSATTNGSIDFRYDFADDDSLRENGFLLLANAIAQSTYGVEANIQITDSLENSSTTYALVQTDSIVGTSVTGSEVVVDSVAVVDPYYTDPGLGAPIVGPDGMFFPAGVARVADGVDTDTAADFRVLDFSNDPAVNQPTAGTGFGGGGGGGTTIDDTPTLISTIQGVGAESDLVGQTVVIEAIVTGDFQNDDGDDSRNLNGFFVMEEDADQDADALTSEGLFVDEFFSGQLVDVSQGDRVRVLGSVSEFGGKTRLQVEEIRIEEAGTSGLVTVTLVDLPDVEAREALENMLVTFAEPLTFSESFDTEAFGELTLTSGGPVYQYTQFNAPDVAGNAAYQAEVADRTILIEDGMNGRRSDFDPIIEPDGDLIGDATTGIRMGQSTSNLTAIMDFDFGEYRLRLPEGSTFDPEGSTNPVPDSPNDVGSGYKIASLNVLNFFTTIDGLTDNGNAPRGADSPEELSRQIDKLVTTLLGMDADVVGLIEIENDFAGDIFALQTLVQSLNDAEGGDRWAFVDPGQEFVGDDAIAVAFIYDNTTTKLVGDAAILDTDAFLDPLGASDGSGFNRAALAQTFQEIDSGGQFTASVNHFKSKGSLTGAPEDEDQGDGAGRNNATREEASRLLAEWLESDPTNSGDDDIMILGDLNSYARETPITVLEDAGYTDLVRAFEGEDVYSYRFSGQIGTLDYALANDALNDQVTGATAWNINSDTPVVFDYNLDNTFGFPNILRPTDQVLFDGDSPLRGSDHDPIVVGLNLEDDRNQVIGTNRFDRLLGTDADDVIISGGGRIDFAEGFAGHDTFVFTNTEGRRDKLVIFDFHTEEDRLDIGDAQIASVKEFSFGVRIRMEDRDTVTLLGVDDFDAINIIGDDGLFFA